MPDIRSFALVAMLAAGAAAQTIDDPVPPPLEAPNEAVKRRVDIIETDWGVAPEPPAVPQPDFVTPVDYFAWYDSAVAHAAKENALARYGVFLYGDNETPAQNLEPPADTQAAQDMEKLLEAPLHWYPEENRGLIKWMQGIERRFMHVFVGAEEYRFYSTRRPPELQLLNNLEGPALGNGRTIGKMLFLRAFRVEKDELDADRLESAIAANLVYARHIAQGSLLDEQLFAIGQHAFVYDMIRRSLNSPVHVAEQWENVVEVLERFDSRPLTLDHARSLYFEEARALQLLQYFCTPGGKSSKLSDKVQMDVVNAYAGWKYPPGRFRPKAIDKLADADPRDLAMTIHAYYEGMRALLRQPHVADLPVRITALEEKTLGLHPELDLLVPSIGMAVQTTFHTEAQRRLVYLFLKMAIAFKYTGTWPDALDKLTGARVAESRIDPYSGKDMKLRPVTITFIPYSVGADGKDDDGDESKDVIYWGRVAQEAYFRGQADVSSNGAPPADAGKVSPAPAEAPASKPPTAP